MIYGIGETVLDIIFRDEQPQRAVPGGSTFNAIISLGRRHLPCTMITQTGDDAVADITMRYLQSNGVDASLVTRVVGMKSHLSLAFLNEQSDANYSFYKDHRGWDVALLEEAVSRVEMTSKDVLLLGSFFAVNPLVRSVVETLLDKAHAAGAMVYYDINYRQPHADVLEHIRPFMEHNMRMATVVRGSIDDFRIAYRMDDPDAIYERVRPLCNTLVITDGARPLHVYRPTGVLTLLTPSITPLSTVGAGDNFNAGWIAAYVQQQLSCAVDSWTNEQLLCLARQGQAWGQEVCMSWDNSVKKI